MLTGGSSGLPSVRHYGGVTIAIEKTERVWTVVHDRPDASNAMDDDSGLAGAAHFSDGAGRHGDFGEI